MTEYRQSDLEGARRFLRKRLDAEFSMSRNLERLFKEAARKIVEICYRYNTRPGSFRLQMNSRMREEIEKVIDELREEITDAYLTLCGAAVSNEQDESVLLMFALRWDDGVSFTDSLNHYLGNFVDEMELLVGAGLFLGLSAKVVAESIGRNLRKPYRNPDLADGIETSISYGRGRTNSMFTAVNHLTKFGIAKTWMKGYYDSHKGALGWWVERGSTYPCSLCDSMTGYHRDDTDLPPYHLACCCIAIPARKDI